VRSEPVRRNQLGVLVVGAAEPEIQPWLHAAGHGVRVARHLVDAEAALEEEPFDLVIVDRDPPTGLDAPQVARKLRADPRLGDAWLLVITVQARGRAADAALNAGADDYLHRPFTRAELLARARAGLRAATQRSNDALLRSLMANVPGAIYRTAWHGDGAVELITDEIENISGHPPNSFVSSNRRTLLGLVHREDRAALREAIAEAAELEEPYSLEYRIVRADGAIRWVLDRGQPVPGPGGRLWLDGALFDVTERRAAEEALLRREIEAARSAELHASRARIIEAADAARRKIERDLHDGAQQRLVSMSLDVRLAHRVVAQDPSAAGPLLERLGEELQSASAELRELARGIHPAVLTERGLGPAVEALATRAPIPVELVDVPGERLAPVTEATAYFTVSEALTNVAKYAQATHATVRLACENGHLVVEVRDDGVGGASPDSGSGLSGLADRVGAADGTLSVDSPLGEGTLIRAVLPLSTA
jgi:PAS domain S-box-containing protein